MRTIEKIMSLRQEISILENKAAISHKEYDLPVSERTRSLNEIANFNVEILGALSQKKKELEALEIKNFNEPA